MTHSSGIRLPARHLVLGLLVLLLLLPAGALTAREQAQDARSVDFFDAVDAGLITYNARGRGVASGAMVALTLTNHGNENLLVMLPPASRFVPDGGETSSTLPVLFTDAVETRRGSPLAQGSTQGGLGGYRYTMEGSAQYNIMRDGIPLSASAEGVFSPNGVLARPTTQVGQITVYIEGYCANAHLDNPSTGTYFIVRPPQDDELNQLMQTFAAQNGRQSTIAAQIAVWILTDDVDLAFLDEVGYTPTDEELRDALLLLQDAGIDISDRQLGQIDLSTLPPTSPPPPTLSLSEPVAVQLRGAVVDEAGIPQNGIEIEAAIDGGQRSGPDFASSTTVNGRFDLFMALYQNDAVMLTIIEGGQEIGQISLSAQEVYDLVNNGGELVLTLTVVEVEVTPTPSVGAITPVTLFGVRTLVSPGNIRAEPTVNSGVVQTVACGDVFPLDAQTLDAGERVWYRLASGGWMRFDTISVLLTREEADSLSARTNCTPPPPTAAPTPVPPPPETGGQNTGGDTGQPVDNSDGGGNPPPPTFPPPTSPPNYNVRVINNAPCEVNVQLGPAGATIASGSYADLSVPEGTHNFTASGTCGSLSSTENITSNAEITIS